LENGQKVSFPTRYGLSFGRKREATKGKTGGFDRLEGGEKAVRPEKKTLMVCGSARAWLADFAWGANQHPAHELIKNKPKEE